MGKISKELLMKTIRHTQLTHGIKAVTVNDRNLPRAKQTLTFPPTVTTLGNPTDISWQDTDTHCNLSDWQDCIEAALHPPTACSVASAPAPGLDFNIPCVLAVGDKKPNHDYGWSDTPDAPAPAPAPAAPPPSPAYGSAGLPSPGRVVCLHSESGPVPATIQYVDPAEAATGRCLLSWLDIPRAIKDGSNPPFLDPWYFVHSVGWAEYGDQPGQWSYWPRV